MDTQLENVIKILEEFKLDSDAYDTDPDYGDYVDEFLRTKIRSLNFHFKQQRFDQLLEGLQDIEIDNKAIHVLVFIKETILPEARRLISQKSTASEILYDGFWNQLNSKVVEVSKSRYESGHYADAVEAAFKELNNEVKRIYLQGQNEEKDGSSLMQSAFSVNNPVIRLANTQNQTGRDIQQGYKDIFAGSMMAIRNPKAHNNVEITAQEAIHFLFLASLLFNKLNNRVR